MWLLGGYDYGACFVVLCDFSVSSGNPKQPLHFVKGLRLSEEEPPLRIVGHHGHGLLLSGGRTPHDGDVPHQQLPVVFNVAEKLRSKAGEGTGKGNWVLGAQGVAGMEIANVRPCAAKGRLHGGDIHPVPHRADLLHFKTH